METINNNARVHKDFYVKIRDVQLHRYRLISVSFSHIGIGIDLKKIEPI